MRGHTVTLWEKTDHIGGQLELVAAPPGKKEFGNLPLFYQTMLNKYGVQVELNHEATVAEIQSAGFDAIIMATGSTPKQWDVASDLPCTRRRTSWPRTSSQAAT